MRKSFVYPTPEQQTLDKAMARAQSHRSSKSFRQWLANLFTAAKRAKRDADAKRLARGNVDEQ